MPAAEVAAIRNKIAKPVTVAGGIATTEEIVDISKMGFDVQVGMALYNRQSGLRWKLSSAVLHLIPMVWCRRSCAMPMVKH